MNHYHILLRCKRSAWAIQRLQVELSVHEPAWLMADEVIANVQRRWKAPWYVCGIEVAP
jgi:hypothetical protein